MRIELRWRIAALFAASAVLVVACTPMRPVPPPAGVAAYRAEAHPPVRASFDTASGSAIELRGLPQALFVEPLVNGVPTGFFLIDTGASAMTISSCPAREARLPIVGSARLMKEDRTAVFHCPEFRLGGFALRDVPLVGLDMRGVPGVGGRSPAGIIGFELFAHAVVEIDSPASTLSLHDPETFSPRADIAWHDLSFRRNHPFVGCRFEGGREGLFVIDSGFAGAVAFFPAAVEEHDLLDGRKTRGRRLMGYEWSTGAREGTLEWFEVGGRRVESVTAMFTKHVPAGVFEEDVAGMIGMDLLRRFQVIFDYPNQRIAFAPAGR